MIKTFKLGDTIVTTITYAVTVKDGTIGKHVDEGGTFTSPICTSIRFIVSHANSDTNSYSNAIANSYTYSDAHTYADTNAYADDYTNCNTYSNAYSVVILYDLTCFIKILHI